MKERVRNLWPLALFLAVALIVLAPIFSGKSLVPADTLKSMPFSKFGAEQFFQHGRIAQWIPYVFGGMPCYGSVMVTPSYLVSVLFTWLLGLFIPFCKDPLAQHLFHLVLMGWGSVLYLRLTGVERRVGVVIGANLILMTTLAGLMGAGHTIKLWTVCWMPLGLYWLERLIREKSWRNLAPAALVLGMMMTAKHVQMTWYFLILAGLYALVRVIQNSTDNKERALSLLRAALWVALGFGLAAFLYLPVLEYSGISMRAGDQLAVAGGQYAAAYSYPPGDLLSWLVPGARGFGGSNYWGALEYTAFPLYMGVLWLPLFVLTAMDSRRRRWIWAGLPAMIVLFFIGIGEHNPLFQVFVDYLPLFGKFRAHMWAIAPLQLMLVLIAGQGLQSLVSAYAEGAASKRRIQLLLGTGVLLLALAGIALQTAPSPDQPLAPGDSYVAPMDQQRAVYYMRQQGIQPNQQQLSQLMGILRAPRAEMYHKDLARTLALLGVMMLLAGALASGRIKPAHLLAALLLLLIVDLLPMDLRTMNWEKARDPAAWFQPTGAMRELAKMPDKQEFRVWPKDGYSHNEAAWYGLHSISGYHGAKLAVMQELLATADQQSGGLLHPHLLDLLNVRYVLSRSQLPGFEMLGSYSDGVLLANKDALPRLSFPTQIEVLPAEQHLARITSGTFDPHQQVLLEQDPGLGSSGGEAIGRIESYEPERIRYRIVNSSPTLALLSEIWVPKGWTATLDGKRVPLLRADHCLRAVPVEATGEHELELVYRPMGWIWGIRLSLLSLLLVASLYWGPVLLSRRSTSLHRDS